MAGAASANPVATNVQGSPMRADRRRHRRVGDAFPIDASAAALRRDCEVSLRTLGVETIDLYQLHHVDHRVPLEELHTAAHGTGRDRADGSGRGQAQKRPSPHSPVSSRSPPNQWGGSVSLTVFPAVR